MCGTDLLFLLQIFRLLYLAPEFFATLFCKAARSGAARQRVGRAGGGVLRTLVQWQEGILAPMLVINASKLQMFCRRGALLAVLEGHQWGGLCRYSAGQAFKGGAH